MGAVIRNKNNKILCALRSSEMSLPNYWEFPGGKIENGEKPEEALVREIQEELGCLIEVGNFIKEVLHEYPTILVNLLTYEAKIISGDPVPSEHSKLEWKEISEIESLAWAPADIPTVKKLIKTDFQK